MPAVLLIALSLLSLPAAARQDPLPVATAIEAWLQSQTKGLPGQVRWEIGELDPGNQLAPCNALDISRPAGSRPWGRGNVLVSCLAPTAWRVYVPVHIHVATDYLVSARAITQGQVIGPDDLATQPGDLSTLPANTLTDLQLAVGKVATTSIPAGRPLRTDMLKGQLIVRQNQTVKVVSRGPGFTVANEGRALGNGMEGQVVQVRLNSGQIVSGTVKADGSVELSL